MKAKARKHHHSAPVTGLANHNALLVALRDRADKESLRNIGYRTGIDVGRLSRFLHGLRDLTFAAACRLAEYLGLQLVAVANAKEELTP